MGYITATAVLKNSQTIPKVAITEGYVSQAKGYSKISFAEADVADFITADDK